MRTLSPRLLKHYANTDDVALHDIASQTCAALIASLRRTADGDGSEGARTEYRAERRRLLRSLQDLCLGDRYWAIRLIDQWSADADLLLATQTDGHQSVH